MIKKFIKNITKITSLTFVIQLAIYKIYNYNLIATKLIEAYFVNYIIAIILFYILDKKKENWQDRLGFVFMGGSFLKFLIFFIVFNPAYKADNETTTLEFFSFFTPYAICLIIEVFYLSKMLNNLNN